jgi:hypothetical protein
VTPTGTIGQLRAERVLGVACRLSRHKMPRGPTLPLANGAAAVQRRKVLCNNMLHTNYQIPSMGPQPWLATGRGKKQLCRY